MLEFNLLTRDAKNLSILKIGRAKLSKERSDQLKLLQGKCET